MSVTRAFFKSGAMAGRRVAPCCLDREADELAPRYEHVPRAFIRDLCRDRYRSRAGLESNEALGADGGEGLRAGGDDGDKGEGGVCCSDLCQGFARRCSSSGARRWPGSSASSHSFSLCSDSAASVMLLSCCASAPQTISLRVQVCVCVCLLGVRGQACACLRSNTSCYRPYSLS